MGKICTRNRLNMCMYVRACGVYVKEVLINNK